MLNYIYSTSTVDDDCFCLFIKTKFIKDIQVDEKITMHILVLNELHLHIASPTHYSGHFTGEEYLCKNSGGNAAGICILAWHQNISRPFQDRSACVKMTYRRRSAAGPHFIYSHERRENEKPHFERNSRPHITQDAHLHNILTSNWFSRSANLEKIRFVQGLSPSLQHILMWSGNRYTPWNYCRNIDADVGVYS